MAASGIKLYIYDEAETTLTWQVSFSERTLTQLIQAGNKLRYLTFTTKTIR